MSAKKSRSAQRHPTRTDNYVEKDSRFFLKLVLYIIVGMIWFRLCNTLDIAGSKVASIPTGLLIGLLFASHDRFQIDRKIEYAVLIIVTITSYFLPAGIIV